MLSMFSGSNFCYAVRMNGEFVKVFITQQSVYLDESHLMDVEWIKHNNKMRVLNETLFALEMYMYQWGEFEHVHVPFFNSVCWLGE